MQKTQQEGDEAIMLSDFIRTPMEKQNFLTPTILKSLGEKITKLGDIAREQQEKASERKELLVNMESSLETLRDENITLERVIKGLEKECKEDIEACGDKKAIFDLVNEIRKVRVELSKRMQQVQELGEDIKKLEATKKRQENKIQEMEKANIFFETKDLIKGSMLQNENDLACINARSLKKVVHNKVRIGTQTKISEEEDALQNQLRKTEEALQKSDEA
eukprot:39986-Ditylum_brightwellii.AAC.1